MIGPLVETRYFRLSWATDIEHGPAVPRDSVECLLTRADMGHLQALGERYSVS